MAAEADMVLVVEDMAEDGLREMHPRITAVGVQQASMVALSIIGLITASTARSRRVTTLATVPLEIYLQAAHVPRTPRHSGSRKGSRYHSCIPAGWYQVQHHHTSTYYCLYPRVVLPLLTHIAAPACPAADGSRCSRTRHPRFDQSIFPSPFFYPSPLSQHRDYGVCSGPFNEHDPYCSLLLCHALPVCSVLALISPSSVG